MGAVVHPVEEMPGLLKTVPFNLQKHKKKKGGSFFREQPPRKGTKQSSVRYHNYPQNYPATQPATQSNQKNPTSQFFLLAPPLPSTNMAGLKSFPACFSTNGGTGRGQLGHTSARPNYGKRRSNLAETFLSVKRGNSSPRAA